MPKKNLNTRKFEEYLNKFGNDEDLHYKIISVIIESMRDCYGKDAVMRFNVALLSHFAFAELVALYDMIETNLQVGTERESGPYIGFLVREEASTNHGVDTLARIFFDALEDHERDHLIKCMLEMKEEDDT